MQAFGYEFPGINAFWNPYTHPSPSLTNFHCHWMDLSLDNPFNWKILFLVFTWSAYCHMTLSPVKRVIRH